MAWTVPTAAFFLAIACALAAMTLWELKSPSAARKGFLPMPTTRGDRFFIALLTAAYVHVAWLAFSDGPVQIASAAAVLLGIILMRWG